MPSFTFSICLTNVLKQIIQILLITFSHFNKMWRHFLLDINNNVILLNFTIISYSTFLDKLVRHTVVIFDFSSFCIHIMKYFYTTDRKIQCIVVAFSTCCYKVIPQSSFEWLQRAGNFFYFILFCSFFLCDSVTHPSPHLAAHSPVEAEVHPTYPTPSLVFWPKRLTRLAAECRSPISLAAGVLRFFFKLEQLSVVYLWFDLCLLLAERLM